MSAPGAGTVPLVIAVSTLGTDAAIANLTAITGAIGRMTAAAGASIGNLGMLGIAVAAVGIVGARNAMATESMTVQLEAFTHSAGIAAKQMEAIEALSARGVFHRDELFEAFRILDEGRVPLEQNILLVQELGVRMHSLSNAAQLLQRIQGSTTGMPFIGRQLLQAGINPEMLQEHGVMMKGMSVLSHKEDLMRALREITSADNAVTKMEDTFNAKWNQFTNQVRITGQHIASDVMGPMGGVLKIVQGVLVTMDHINTATGGWFAKIGAIMIGVATITAGMRAILGLTIIETSWMWIQTAIWTMQQAGAAGLLALLEESLIVQIAQSFFASIAAAALGNPLPLAGWIAGAALIGGASVAVYNNVKGQMPEMPKGLNSPDQDSHSRPVRHDEVENVYKRMRGFNYS
jgi:hypothetical protein